MCKSRRDKRYQVSNCNVQGIQWRRTGNRMLIKGTGALVTGAASGIGRGVAEALLESGARVSDVTRTLLDTGVSFNSLF